MRDSRRPVARMERISSRRHHLQHCSSDFTWAGMGLRLAPFSQGVARNRSGTSRHARLEAEMIQCPLPLFTQVQTTPARVESYIIGTSVLFRTGAGLVLHV
jgi:hypothetical protein